MGVDEESGLIGKDEVEEEYGCCSRIFLLPLSFILTIISVPLIIYLIVSAPIR